MELLAMSVLGGFGSVSFLFWWNFCGGMIYPGRSSLLKIGHPMFQALEMLIWLC
jgi:hypothetical protein